MEASAAAAAGDAPPAAAPEPSGSIRRIAPASVHRICSGQVVLDLASAAKELVENALDAGATTVEVRLSEHGAALLEVADNGGGVAPENHAALTLKYHTSKLREFEDLMSLGTFGFRGEALSSLCALADLSVVTRTAGEAVGHRIEYDHDGRVRSKEACARAVGTTVALKNLFQTLPVRHKDFTRNVKREYGKLLGVLQAYALVADGVRLVCTHQAGRAPRQTVVQTAGRGQMRDNLVTVFGAKAVGVLAPVDLGLANGVRASGFISQPAAGCGRASSDRQFFYVNRRPVDLPKVAKVLNEVYRSFNANQHPMAVLNFEVDTTAYDVNVTPDKRKVLLHGEADLLQSLRDGVVALYEPSRYTFAVAGGSSMAPPPPPPPKAGAPSSTAAEAAAEDGADDEAREPAAEEVVGRPERATTHSTAEDSEATHAAAPPFPTPTSRPGKAPLQTPPPPQQQQRTLLQGFVTRTLRPAQRERARSPEPARQEEEDDDDEGRSMERSSPFPEPLEAEAESETPRASLPRPSVDARASLGAGPPPTPAEPAHDVVEIDMAEEEEEGSAPAEADRRPDDAGDPEDGGPSLRAHADVSYEAVEAAQDAGLAEDEDDPAPLRAVPFDLDALCARRKRARQEETPPGGHDGGAAAKAARRFQAASLQPGVRAQAATGAEAEAAAERELERVFNKADFARMRVVGQFNLGFILATLGSDLFIVDQHASDEKHNFERLQRTTALNRQPLITPQPLDLSAAEEQTARQHAETFNANGFKLVDGPDGGLCMATAPFSKTTTFGAGDVQELVALLDGGEAAASSGDVVRPSRVRAMLAMRACRSSIMIGTALDKPQMRRVLANLAQLHAPWNCPHGRPTMRHLANLAKLGKPEAAAA